MEIRRLICAVFILFFTANAVFAIEEELLKYSVNIKDGSNLSIIDCVALAFQNSPKIKRQKYNLDIAKSHVGIARSQYFPVISAGASFYHENNSNSVYYDKYYRELPNVGVSVNELIWNFGKTTAFIKMEEFYKIGAEYEFMDSLCATLFDVKAKYYNVLKEQALVWLWKENLDINDRFVKIAKKEPDITTAKIYQSQAQVKYIDAQNGYRNAVVDLNNSMYLDNQPKYTVKNTPTFNLKSDFYKNMSSDAFKSEVFDFPIDKAVDIAYQNSPDLQVLISTKKAMEQSLKYIKRTYFPDLRGDVGYGFLNTNVTDNNSFRVGVSLTSAVNLMELKHSLKGAEAGVHLADNEINLFKKDLYFEVKRAFNNVDRAQRQIPIAEKSAIEAKENLQYVEKQYVANKLDYVALQNARKEYIEETVKYVSSIYDYNLALIQVEMAMHYHIFDIHHKSEHAVHYHSDDLIQHLVEALNCEGKEEQNHKDKKVKKNRREKL